MCQIRLMCFTLCVCRALWVCVCVYVICLLLFLRFCCCCCSYWIIIVGCLLLRALNTLSHSHLTLQHSACECVALYVCVCVRIYKQIYIYIYAHIQQTISRMCLGAVCCSNKWLNDFHSLSVTPFACCLPILPPHTKIAHMCIWVMRYDAAMPPIRIVRLILSYVLCTSQWTASLAQILHTHTHRTHKQHMHECMDRQRTQRFHMGTCCCCHYYVCITIYIHIQIMYTIYLIFFIWSVCVCVCAMHMILLFSCVNVRFMFICGINCMAASLFFFIHVSK